MMKIKGIEYSSRYEIKKDKKDSHKHKKKDESVALATKIINEKFKKINESKMQVD